MHGERVRTAAQREKLTPDDILATMRRGKERFARKNVELTMARIRETSAVIRELESANKVKIAGAMYNLATAKIDFFS